LIHGAAFSPDRAKVSAREGAAMNEIIYLIGLVVVVLFILGALGLR
jgi:hypothetical protein